ncbi:MAG: carboxy terminal-processing peptidase [Firmicutes bacterium]|nr:carboxy terminal-processing peptidase [Bacillota bacterium]
MRRLSFRAFPVIIGIVVILMVLTASLTGQEPSREQVLNQLVMGSLTAWHYASPSDTDLWSAQAFDLYLKALDYNKRFFTQGDLKTLLPFRTKLDDEVRRGTNEFYVLSWELLSKRLREVQGYTDTFLAEPLDFGVQEYIELDPEKREHPKDAAAIKELWRKLVKAQTLNVYLDLLLAEENTADTLAEKFEAIKGRTLQPELEEQARVKVRNDLDRFFRRVLEEKEEDRYARYLNALTSSYDPHSNYLAPKAKADFDIRMSGTLEGIGATLQEEGEYIKVVSIEPGGPSWRQGQLKAGDLILKVAQGDEEPVDVTNMPVDEAVQLIRGKKGTEVRLTIKKPEGQTEVISIIRDVVSFEGKYAQSLVIETGKTGPKVGYIALPSFYHDFNNPNGRTSAADVRNELERLKKEQVEGVILDLRNNPGGALHDAVKMAGLFIESGPIVQSKNKKGEIKAFYDPDPAVVYDGPLVVMINSMSASASEILAAALQDYGRAVIVGSAHSFGKGTVQGLIDLDNFLDYLYPRYASYKPLGTLKFTEEKYYRINGGTTQLEGVQADLVLPDPYAYLEIGERYRDYALPWDQVASLDYVPWSGTDWNLAVLAANSAQRIAAHPGFALVQKNIEQIRKQQEATLQPLQLAEFIEHERKVQLDAEKLNATPLPTIGTDWNFVGKREQDEGHAAWEQEWLDQIQTDLYLEEAVNVLLDILSANHQAVAA